MTARTYLIAVLVLLALATGIFGITYKVRTQTSSCGHIFIPNSYKTNLSWPEHDYRQIVFDMFIIHSLDKMGEMTKPDASSRGGSEHQQRHLVLVSTYYGDQDVDVTKLSVLIGKQTGVGSDWHPLTEYEEMGLREREPLRAIRYRLPDDVQVDDSVLTVKLTYKTVTREYKDLPVMHHAARDRHGGIAIATLFKDDYSEIPAWYRYYKQQGVTQFYLYYNGDLSLVHDKLMHAPDITYQAWPFRYWNRLESWYWWPYEHHAQMAFLTTVWLRYQPLHDWFILADLDEFIQCKSGKILRDYLQAPQQQDQAFIMVKNTWAYRKTSEDDTKADHEDHEDHELNGLTIVPNAHSLGCPDRSKVIYNARLCDGWPGIHQPKQAGRAHIDCQCSEELSMFHVASSMTHYQRKNKVRQPAKPVQLYRAVQ